MKTCLEETQNYLKREDKNDKKFKAPHQKKKLQINQPRGEHTIVVILADWFGRKLEKNTQ